MTKHWFAIVLALFMTLFASCATKQAPRTQAPRSQARHTQTILTLEQIQALVDKDQPEFVDRPNDPIPNDAIIVSPIKQYQPSPHYPFECKKAGIQGIVLLSFIVNEQGRSEQIEVLYAPHPAMGEACRQALAISTYIPGTVDGKPSNWKMRQTFDFRLNIGFEVLR